MKMKRLTSSACGVSVAEQQEHIRKLEVKFDWTELVLVLIIVGMMLSF